MQTREMDSLIGYLNFTCSVVLPGRAFLRRLISSIMGIKEPYHMSRSPLRWNLIYCCGRHLLVPSMESRCSYMTASFRAVSYRCILILQLPFAMERCIVPTGFMANFPPQCRKLNITLLELYPIVTAVNVLGHLLQNHSLRIYIDNQALVYILNRTLLKTSTLSNF